MKTLIEINALQDGEQIDQTKGLCKSLSAREDGQGDQGPWTRQNMILAEGPTEIEVRVWNHEPISPTLAGKTVHLIAHRKAAGGTSGVKKKVYNGKTVIDVSKSGEVVKMDGAKPEPTKPATTETAKPTPKDDMPAVGPSKKAAVTTTQPTQTAPVNQPATNQTNVKRSQDVQALIDVKHALMRHGNALGLAADQALLVIEDFSKRHGVAWTEETKKGCVMAIADKMTETMFTTLYIGIQRVGMTDTMPTGDLSKLIEAAKASK